MDTAQRKVRKKSREGVGVRRDGVGVKRKGFLFFPQLSISRHPQPSERLEKARIVVFLN